MLRAITVLVAVVFMVTLLVTPGSSAGPWTLFGAAAPTRSGAAPNPWAVRLTSDTSISNDGDDYSGVLFQDPDGTLTFADIFGLSTDFVNQVANCGGGSPRFSIRIDEDNNGELTGNDGNIWVYLGVAPNYVNCSNDPGWTSSGNLIGLPNSDTRYDLSQVGGGFYDTYNNALSLHGAKRVFYVSLVVDGGWMFPSSSYRQVIDVDKVVVNQHALVARGFR